MARSVLGSNFGKARIFETLVKRPRSADSKPDALVAAAEHQFSEEERGRERW